MNLQNLLNEFTGAAGANQSQQGVVTGSNQGGFTSGLPGGLVGGAAAGGIMALLVGNKKARKFAGKAATYGGAAVLGGIAYSAYKNWQSNEQQRSAAASSRPVRNPGFESPEAPDFSADFQLTLVKAMIAAAKADGHIDQDEQKRIFDAVEQMQLDPETKGVVFDLLRQPIYIEELSHRVSTLEQKSEVYLASCMAINPDHPSEQDHLGKLARVLALPPGLAEHLQQEAQRALESETR